LKAQSISFLLPSPAGTGAGGEGWERRRSRKSLTLPSPGGRGKIQSALSVDSMSAPSFFDVNTGVVRAFRALLESKHRSMSQRAG
jgi:hypothetical protein